MNYKLTFSVISITFTLMLITTKFIRRVLVPNNIALNSLVLSVHPICLIGFVFLITNLNVPLQCLDSISDFFSSKRINNITKLPTLKYSGERIGADHTVMVQSFVASADRTRSCKTALLLAATPARNGNVMHCPESTVLLSFIRGEDERLWAELSHVLIYYEERCPVQSYYTHSILKPHRAIVDRLRGESTSQPKSLSSLSEDFDSKGYVSFFIITKVEGLLNFSNYKKGSRSLKDYFCFFLQDIFIFVSSQWHLYMKSKRRKVFIVQWRWQTLIFFIAWLLQFRTLSALALQFEKLVILQTVLKKCEKRNFLKCTHAERSIASQCFLMDARKNATVYLPNM
uniref:Transmembrane protein n=1 Tax=Glossina pallidipes TaxID=7398 RepID=A0A1A9Z2Y2_GLOPL